MFSLFGSVKERCLIRLSTPTTDDGPHCRNPTKIFLSPRESSVKLLIFDEFSQNIIQQNFTFLMLNRSHPTWQDQSKPYSDEFNGSI